MKASVIKVANLDYYMILFPDGTVAQANQNLLREFLTGFRTIDSNESLKNGSFGRWSIDDPLLRRATTYAYVTDDNDLYILDFAPFLSLLGNPDSKAKLLTTKEYAKKHGVSVERIKTLFNEGRLRGAVRVGDRFLVIPEDAPYPSDARMTAGGKYVGARSRYNK